MSEYAPINNSAEAVGRNESANSSTSSMNLASGMPRSVSPLVMCDRFRFGTSSPSSPPPPVVVVTTPSDAAGFCDVVVSFLSAMVVLLVVVAVLLICLSVCFVVPLYFCWKVVCC